MFFLSVASVIPIAPIAPIALKALREFREYPNYSFAVIRLIYCNFFWSSLLTTLW